MDSARPTGVQRQKHSRAISGVSCSEPLARKIGLLGKASGAAVKTWRNILSAAIYAAISGDLVDGISPG